MNRAVVVGGGIGGLATSVLLAREGYEVTLLESRETLGGRAGLWERDGFRFDTGPSWYLMPEVFEHFFAMAGTRVSDELDLVNLDPGYAVFYEPDATGRSERAVVEANRAANLALAESWEPGAGEKLNRYLDSAKETYELAKTNFLYSTFADLRPVFTRQVVKAGARFTRLLLQPLDRFVRGRFKDGRLRRLLGYPAVFLGGSPFDVPSMYHLMSHLDLDGGVLYPRGGIYTVIEALERLARREGVEILTGSRATRILSKPIGGGKPSVLGVTFDGSDGPGEVRAGTVVLAADLPDLERALLPPALRDHTEAWWGKRTPGPGAVLVNLGVRGSLPELEHHNLFFVDDWEGNFRDIFGGEARIPDPASIYVCKPSATDSGVAPAGHENMFILVPVPADIRIGHGGEDGRGEDRVERAADAAIEQVSRWAGIPDLAERIVLRRTMGPADLADDLGAWNGSALGPAHTLRQSAFFRAGNQSTRLAGLYYAGGSTIPGIGLPMCLISAELVLKRLRGDVSAGPSPEPAV